MAEKEKSGGLKGYVILSVIIMAIGYIGTIL